MDQQFVGPPATGNRGFYGNLGIDTMSSKKSHHVLWSLIITMFTVYVIVPHLPGASFTGGILMAAFVSLVNFAVLISVILALFISVAGGALFFLIRRDWDPKRFSPRRYFGFFLKLGLWGSLATSTAFAVLLSAISWKITSWMFASLAFAGFAPALYTAAVVLLIGAIPSVVSNPRRYSEAAFTAWILAEIAKAETKQDDFKPEVTQQSVAIGGKGTGRSKFGDGTAVNSEPTDVVVEADNEPSPSATPEAGHSDSD